LKVTSGSISKGSVTLLLGPNGSGKTSFINSLAGRIPVLRNGKRRKLQLKNIEITHKDQHVYVEKGINTTVREYLINKSSGKILDPTFFHEIVIPLKVEHLLDQQIDTLSGGEMQKIAIIAALGQNSNLYLIDEPSCYLDIESVLIVAKIIKRFAKNNGKYIFVVEHDFNLGLRIEKIKIMY